MIAIVAIMPIMLTYVRLGQVAYTTGLGSYRERPEWEFQACLDGQLACITDALKKDPDFRGHTLWVFPSRFRHGWHSETACERVVFHFSNVPGELELNLPVLGYYVVALSKVDCARLRFLAKAGLQMQTTPSKLDELKMSTLLGELSLMPLNDASVGRQVLEPSELAIRRTRTALQWYGEHMHENPGLPCIARAISVSPSYLRTLFYRVLKKSPQQAMTRLRMARAAHMIYEGKWTLEAIAEQVGLSGASALSRAIKAHYGCSPRTLRTRKEWAPESASIDIVAMGRTTSRNS